MAQPNAANKATSRRFRHATMRDLPHMQKIYARARELMAANGNPTQWGNEFPRESVIEDDIANQRTVLLVQSVVGGFALIAMSVFWLSSHCALVRIPLTPTSMGLGWIMIPM